MNYSGKRRKILLLFASLVAALGLWLLFKKDEPRYQGKTANQWVYAAARRQVTSMEYEKAVEILNTNFVPVAIRFAKTRDRFMMIERLCSDFNKWLPKGTEKILPPDFGSHQEHVWKSIGQLGRFVPIEPQMAVIQAALKDSHPHHQPPVAGMLSCLVTGKEGVSVQEYMRHINHTNFTVRLHSCIVSARLAIQPSYGINLGQMASVLENAMTNSTLMVETFGRGASYWQSMAFTNLAMVSPETAAKYQNYLKD